MARTIRKSKLEPWPPEEWARFEGGVCGGSLRGITRERANARLKGDHNRTYYGFGPDIRRMFNRLHRARMNHALRNDPFVEVLPHKHKNDRWRYD